MPDLPTDEPADEIDPRTAARPLRRIRHVEPPAFRVPHSNAALALRLVALLSLVCGIVVGLIGFAGSAALVGIGIQGVIAAVTLFAFSVVVYGVEEIAYWTRRVAERLERQEP